MTEHVYQYSGVDYKDALQIEHACDSIMELAAMIGAKARETLGDKDASKLVGKVRKAIGYIYP